MLEEVRETLYPKMHHQMHYLAQSAKDTARKLGIPHRINRVGSMMTLFFTDAKVVNFQSAKTADTARYGRFFRELLTRGIYFAPSQFESAFTSAAHTDQQIEETARAVSEALHAVA